jgi:hypothetical protein
MKRAKFAVGQIVATPGALETMKAHNIDGLELLRRHVTGCWVTWTGRTSRRMSCPSRRDSVFCRLTGQGTVNSGS